MLNINDILTFFVYLYYEWKKYVKRIFLLLKKNY